jgi:hypothetical protein
MSDATTRPGFDDTPPARRPAGDLTLTPERLAVIGPKLQSLLEELARMEALEAWEVEPDTADAWGATTRVGQNEVTDER